MKKLPLNQRMLPVTLTLDAETVKRATLIGKGNMSAGVRLSVKTYPVAMPKGEIHAIEK